MQRYSIKMSTGKDSSGKAFGLEMAHFMPILIALVFSMTLFFLLNTALSHVQVSLMAKAVLGFSPLAISVFYVFFFLVGKPPHFQEDFLNTLISGKDAGVIRRKKCKPRVKGSH